MFWSGNLRSYINRNTPLTAAVSNMKSFKATGENKQIVQASLLEQDTIVPFETKNVAPGLMQQISEEKIKKEIVKSFEKKYAGLKEALKSTMNNQDITLDYSISSNRASHDEDRNYYDPIRSYFTSHSEFNSDGKISSYFKNSDEDKFYKRLYNFEKNELENLKNQILEDIEARIESITPMLNIDSKALDSLAKDYVAHYEDLHSTVRSFANQKSVFDVNYLQTLIKQPKLADSKMYLPIDAVEKTKLNNMGQVLTKMGAMDLLKKQIDKQYNNRSVFDLEASTISELGPAIVFGIREAADVQGISINRSKRKIFNVFVKSTLIHEVGHMLGLGHNFKANIYPKKGSVPNFEFEDIIDDNGKILYRGLRSMKNDNMTNYTTVMGYKHPLTTVYTDYEDIRPGPHDTLVLEYLYNGRYPVVPSDTCNEIDGCDVKDYSWVYLKEDGLILEENIVNGKKMKLAYFPACNDSTASMGSDPLCNRHDRGYDPETVMESYLYNYRRNLTSSLYAFDDSIKGGHYQYMENYLWQNSLTTFSRTRTFYDYMRQTFRSEISNVISKPGEKGSKNLMEFSTSCLDEDDKRGYTPNKDWLEAFEEKPDLRKYCRAVNKMISEFESFLTLPSPDSTVIDYDKAYHTASILTGDAKSNMGSIYGRWKELSRTPIKISALIALTSSNAFTNFRGWLIPIHRYSREDARYLVSTLYAKEFSKTIASTVDWNLTIANTELDSKTKIGKAVLSLGYLLRKKFRSNDSLAIDPSHLAEIDEQTKFRYSVAIVEVEKRDKKDGSTKGQKI